MLNTCKEKKMKQEIVSHYVLLECYSLLKTDMLNESVLIYNAQVY